MIESVKDGVGPTRLRLSVVVASTLSHSYLIKCLDSIFMNKEDGVEVIVADCRRDESSIGLKDKYPEVIFIQFPDKVTLPVLWGAGIARSSAEIIAVTDSSCIVDSKWIQSIVQAHQSPSPVIGGAVEISNGMKLVDLAAYFCEYGQFMYPLKSGVVDALPGNNISFKRWALEKGNEYVRKEFWKAHWCRKLQEEGIELISEPSIIVYYAKSYNLVQFFVRRFHHGRCFAGMRVERDSFFKRALYAVGSIFLPFLFLFRTIQPILEKKRLLKELILSLPFSVLAIVFWSFGETCGYLAGTGRSCEYIY